MHWEHYWPRWEKIVLSHWWLKKYDILEVLVCRDKASTHDWLNSGKQACCAFMPCFHATPGHRRQSLIYGETTCRVWRGLYQGLHWGWRSERKAMCFEFKIHVKWGKEARSLLTTIPGQQLLRLYMYVCIYRCMYVYVSVCICIHVCSWQEIQMLTGPDSRIKLS